MMNNYNSLNYRKFSKFSSQEPEVVGNSPNSGGKKRTLWLVGLIMSFLFFGQNVFSQTTVTYTSSGSWTAPPGVTSVTVEVWGAGGGGGGASSGAGGGGAGGGYVKATYAVTPGTAYTYTVGAAGSATTAAAGGAGGATWFGSSSTISAVGGAGGGYTASGNGAAGIAATTGNLASGAGVTLVSSYYGGSGAAATSTYSGGGGSSASTTSNGVAATSNTGATVTGGFAGGAGSTGTNNAGSAGTSPGGGGGGARRTSGTKAGGAGGSGQVAITFTCPNISSFPWTENFDSMSSIGSNILPSCWAQQTGSSTWTSSNAASNSYNDPRSGANYMTIYYGSTPDYLWTPPFQLTAGTSYDFSFYFVGDLTSGWNGNVYVNGSQSSTGATALGASYIVGATTTLGGTSYTLITRSFTPTTSGVYYFGVNAYTSTTSPWYLGFDDFSVKLTPTCVSPTALTSSSLTSNGATIGWTASTTPPTNGYDYYVSTSSAAPTGSTTPTGNVGTTTYSAVLTGLTANTTYYYWVRSNCSVSDQSTWAGSGTFTTLCTAVSVPYNEGFESLTVANTLPSCMASSPTVASGGKVQTYIASATGTNAALVANTGSKFGAVYWSPSATAGYFFSPPIQLTGGTSYTAKVFYKTDGVAWTDVTLYYGTSATTAAMTNTIATVANGASTSYTPVSGAFTPPSTGVYYVAFRAYNSTSSPNYCAFDDFSVYVTPTCFEPTAVTSSAVTNNSANISWTAPTQGSPSTYEYEVRTSGAAGSGATGLAASGTVTAPTVSASVTGLSAQTTYSIYVRTFCGGTDYSTWTLAATFTTLCNAVSSFPFTETFDATSTSLGCWGVSAGTGASYQWAVTTADATHGVAGPAASTRFAYLNVFNASTTYNTYNLITPSFTLDATPKRFKYKYFLGTGGYKGTSGATGSDPYPLQVMISVNGGAYTMLYGHTSTNSTFATTTATTEWKSNIIDLTAYASQTIKLAFVSNSNFGSGICNQAIDEVTVETIPTSISSFSPATVCSQAGSTITINGAQFTGATAVKFNGVDAASYTVVSNTQITAVAPIGVTAGYITVNGVNNTATSATMLGVTNNPTLSPITITGGATPTCLNLDDTSDDVQLSNTYPGGTWSSSDISIATVNGSGLVTPLAEGTVTITYTASAGSSPSCSSSVTKDITIYKPVVISASTSVQTVVTGNNAVFSVTATGTGMTYQWQESAYDAGTDTYGPFVAITDAGIYSGATTSSLTITGTPDTLNGYQYMCTITGTSPCGSVDSNPATLNVGDTGITGDPADVSLCENGSGTASFTVIPSGTVDSYIWYENQGLGFNPITNGTVAGVTYDVTVPGTLTLTGLTLANTGWTYKVDVVGPANTASSNAALLTINQAPSFSVDPSNQTVCYTGGSASFGATLTGNYTGVQWQYSTDNATWNNVVNGTPVGATYTGSSYTGSSYTGSLGVTTTASTPVSGTYYYKAVALATAPCSGTSSASAQLIINNPTVTTAPSATTVLAGNSTTFSAAATAALPMTYQWQYATTLNGTYADVVNGTPAGVSYTGATTATLTVSTATSTVASTANFYRLVVNPGGCSTTSTGAKLTITNYCTPAPSSQDGTGIVNVAIGTINNATGSEAGYYGNYTTLSTDLNEGTTVPFSITYATGYTYGTKIWIDFNKNGSFEDAGEQVYYGLSTSTNPTTLSGTFNLPIGTPSGVTRMRIGGTDADAGPTSSCYTGTYGTFEDYTINIIPAPACSGTPVAGTVTSSVANVCFTGTATLTANGYTTGVTGISLQWYNSAGAISGATNATYTTPTLSASETYFMRVTCANGGAYADTNSITIGVDAPAVDTTTPNTRCGTGTVVLGATGSAGSTLNWYASATGGTSLGTGTSFTTPSISATTTYYVEPSVGGTSAVVGPVSPTAQGGTIGTQTVAWNVNFTTLSPTKLKTVTIYPIASGQSGVLTVRTGSSTSGTVLKTVNYTTSVSGGATAQIIAIDLDMPTAGTYNIYTDTLPSSGLSRNTSGAIYPYTSSLANITGNGYDSNYFMGLYNWSFGSGCTGSRTAVTATVTAPPALTLNGASTAICNGNTSNAVSITSTISDYDTYTWSPNTGVSGSAATGFTFNPTATTVYTLTASNTSGCVNTATYTVTVNPLPTAAAITPSSPSICLNSVQSLTVNTGGTATFGTGTTATAATSYPNPLSAYYGGVKHQMLYTVAELTAQGLQAGSQINAVTFYINNFAANACTDFTIRIGTTSNTALSGFVTGTSTVYGPTTFTPSATGLVSFTLTTPYVWDGSSNLVIETVHNAGNGGNGSGTRTRVSTTTNNSVYYGAKDNVAGGITGFDALTSYSLSGASTSRPNMTFVFTNIAPTWSPTTDLYTNAGATTAYTGSSLGVVYAKPSTTTTYTATYTSSFGCTSTSTVTVTVSPTSVAGTATATDSTICSGSSTSLTLNGYTGSIQWQSSANGSTGWTNVSGATSASLTTANLTATTYYKAVVTSGVCSSATSNVVTVTVSPTSVAGTASAAASTLCSGTSTTLTLSGSTGSIQWQEASSATGPWTDVSGATSVTLNTGNLTATTYYQAVVTSGVCSSVTSNSVTVTVVPVSVAGTASALSTQFCAGLGTSLSLTGNTGSIQWQQASSATGPWTNVSGATSASLSTGNLTATTYYQAVVTNSVCSSATSNVVTVTVNPIPTVTVSLGNAVLCPNTTTTVTAVPGLAGTYNYVWTVPAGVTNPGNVDSFTTGVAGVYRVVITNPSTGCVSTQASSSLSISTQCATLTSCGITLAALDTPIYSTLVANAQGYRWRVTKMINGVASTNPADIQSIDTQLRTFKIVQLTSYAFDTQYQVEVAVRVNNVWPTYYSAACTFRTPATTTQIISTQCGGTLAMMTDVVYADIVSYTSGYRFKVTNLLNTNDVQIIDRSLREFRFNLLNNIPFNNPYKIEVAIRNTDGTYLPYGPACTVTTPSFPTTALQNSQCDYVATSTTELIYANLVSNATLYRFYFTNTALGYSYTVDKPLRVFQLNTIPGLSGGTTYTVQVAVQIGGVFGPYGKACTITTPVALNAKSEAVATAAVSPTATFEVMALPNPFAENFKLDVQTSSDALIHVKVYDMLGKLLESREVTATDVQTLEVGSNYPSGVYNVIVTQGDNAKTLRVIKR